MEKSFDRLLKISLLAMVALCVCPNSVLGQTVVRGQTDPGGPFKSSIERRQAEQDLRALPQKLREKRERNFQDPKVLEQMNEDFVELQVIRAELVKKFAAGKLIDADTLERSSQGVKKRASRLRSMLALSEDPGDVKLRIDDSPTIESLNDRAYDLCIEISRFTQNPMFSANGVITIKQVAEVSETLDLVIALAETIRKETDRLR